MLEFLNFIAFCYHLATDSLYWWPLNVKYIKSRVLYRISWKAKVRVLILLLQQKNDFHISNIIFLHLIISGNAKVNLKLVKPNCIKNKLTKYKKYPPKPILSIEISSKIIRKLWSEDKCINHICTHKFENYRLPSISE
jgi:hypothetical protein